jgi:hypothetical protein
MEKHMMCRVRDHKRRERPSWLSRPFSIFVVLTSLARIPFKRLYHASASSSALASFRSAVSNPSVNQS